MRPPHSADARAKSLTRPAALWQKPWVLATFLHSFGPFIFRIGGYGPRWYGLSYVLSALVGYWLYRRLAARGYSDVKPEKVADFITWCGLFGVLLGGRAGWIIFYGIGERHDSPWWMFEVWKGGMASHGGILGLVLVTFVLSRRWKVSWTGIGDTLCVVATAGLFLVRCANFINGELIGKPADVAWAVQFPRELLDTDIGHDVLGPAVVVKLGLAPADIFEKGPRDEETNRMLNETLTRIVDDLPRSAETDRVLRENLTPRHPSQLYEALLEGVLMFAVLWFMRTRCRTPRGVITGTFFILYATVRIIGEMFREPDPAWAVGSFSAGQFLSLFMYGIGAVFIVWGLRTRHYERADAVRP